KLSDLGFTREIEPSYFSVKVPVFPFDKLPGSDPLLGPEMRSTGEVMGIDPEFGVAFAKAQMATGKPLPTEGTAFISVKNKDKRAVIFIAKVLHDLGFKIIATHGTAKVLLRHGMEVTLLYKIGQGRPTIYDYIKNNAVDIIINTPTGRDRRPNEVLIRKLALSHRIPLVSTISGAQAAASGIEALIRKGVSVRSIQEYYSNPT
ncbi:TPA: carbamoyl phosphate synthase large subunit, partial [Candidatus Poribacteria bacterium]|nr:carbamoyl phosphate synthase large subunit [Candidatus Poribacteria bacterium]